MHMHHELHELLLLDHKVKSNLMCSVAARSRAGRRGAKRRGINEVRKAGQAAALTIPARLNPLVYRVRA